MKPKNLKVNAILNVIRTSLAIIFPLITYPYAIRTLGVVGLGRVTFSTSIANYFSLLAMLGVATYGVREGAKRRENQEELDTFVSEVFTINCISTLVSFLLMLLVTVLVNKLIEYRLLIIILSSSFVFTTIGMDWLNTVFEEFRRITIRSIITYLISLILLFLFVKSKDDVYQYAILIPLTNLIVCVSNLYFIHRHVKVRLVFNSSIKKHIKPLLILFANAIAIMVYVNVDNTMLGWFKGDYEVGLYAIPVRIYHTLKTVLAAVYAVAIPRLALHISNNDTVQYKNTFSALSSYLATLLIPTCVGLACVSNETLLLIGSSDTAIGGTLSLQILSGSLLFAIFGGLVTAVINITINREKINLFATIVSAVLNLLLNFIFIPLFGLNGAAFTTLLSELVVFVFCLIKDKDVLYLIDFRRIMKAIFQATFGSAVIILLTILCHAFVDNDFWRLTVIIVSSVISYGTMMVCMKNECAAWGINYLKSLLKKLHSS